MVPPSSHGIPRVPWYSGSCRPGFASPTRLSRSPVCFPTHFGSLCRYLLQSETPAVFLLLVWPLPRSLATTGGISVDFSSSPYLDVSVQAVPLIYLCIQYTMHGLLHADCSIRISADLCSLTAPRSFSQLTTSFIGSQCQGIHSALFFALPFASWFFSRSHEFTRCSFYPT